MRSSLSKGQASMEFLILVGAFLVLLSLAMVIAWQQIHMMQSKKNYEDAAAALQRLGEMIYQVYLEGEGARREAVIQFPEGIDPDKTYISGNTIYLTVDGTTYARSFPFDVQGELPNSSGPKKIVFYTRDKKVYLLYPPLVELNTYQWAFTASATATSGGSSWTTIAATWGPRELYLTISNLRDEPVVVNLTTPAFSSSVPVPGCPTITNITITNSSGTSVGSFNGVYTIRQFIPAHSSETITIEIWGNETVEVSGGPSGPNGPNGPGGWKKKALQYQALLNVSGSGYCSTRFNLTAEGQSTGDLDGLQILVTGNVVPA